MKKTPRRFTLIEMLCVMLIIGILVGAVTLIAGKMMSKGYEEKTKAMVKIIETAVETYKQRFGGYPILNPAYNTADSATIRNYILLPYFFLDDIGAESTWDSDPTKNPNNNLVGCFHDVVLDGDRIVSIRGLDIANFGIANTSTGNSANSNKKQILVDAYGTPIIYIYPGFFNNTRFDLGSLGANRSFGGDPAYYFATDDRFRAYDHFTFSSNGGMASTVWGNKDFKTGTVFGTYANKNTPIIAGVFGQGDDIVNFAR